MNGNRHWLAGKLMNGQISAAASALPKAPSVVLRKEEGCCGRPSGWLVCDLPEGMEGRPTMAVLRAASGGHSCHEARSRKRQTDLKLQ